METKLLQADTGICLQKTCEVILMPSV